jgi:hypothetical protein
MKNNCDPTMTLPAPRFAVTYDLVYDDAVVDVATVDERMRHYGCFPETVDTKIASPSPYLGILSPDGNIWKISVDDLGVLTTEKVT